MWQHDIVESIKESCREWVKSEPEFFTRKKVLPIYLDRVISVLSSPCFFLGESDSFIDASHVMQGKPCFSISPPFPFPYFVLEYTKKMTGKKEEYQVDCSKRCLVVQEAPAALRGQMDFSVGGFFYFDDYKIWSPTRVFLTGKWDSEQMQSWQSPLIPEEMNEIRPLSEEGIRRTTQELGEEVTVLAAFLEFINCKNVYTETVTPPEQLNKKRIKNKKCPMLEYKI